MGPEVHLCVWRGSDQGHDVRIISPHVASCSSFASRWGESAGAVSVAAHMLANGGDTGGLFRAGFMESGSPAPLGFVDEPFLQTTYDGIGEATGCSKSNDTLACLRTVSAAALTAAMDKTPTFESFQVGIP